MQNSSLSDWRQDSRGALIAPRQFIETKTTKNGADEAAEQDDFVEARNLIRQQREI